MELTLGVVLRLSALQIVPGQVNLFSNQEMGIWLLVSTLAT
jgi:hypothetical protein